MGVNEGDLQVLRCRRDPGKILRIIGCKYKATTWYLKKNQNAPRPSEHPLLIVKTKQRQCSIIWQTISFYTTPVGNFIVYKNEQRAGGERCQTFFFFFFFFPCSADHERDWPPCKVVFFGLATNALNVRNNNNNNNIVQYLVRVSLYVLYF